MNRSLNIWTPYHFINCEWLHHQSNITRMTVSIEEMGAVLVEPDSVSHQTLGLLQTMFKNNFFLFIDPRFPSYESKM